MAFDRVTLSIETGDGKSARMTIIASDQVGKTGRTVNVMLTSARVTEGFREALFDAAATRNLTPTEFVLIAAAERLSAFGYGFPGVFRVGDLPQPAAPQDHAA